jgi:hypothetical protein
MSWRGPDQMMWPSSMKATCSAISRTFLVFSSTSSTAVPRSPGIYLLEPSIFGLRSVSSPLLGAPRFELFGICVDTADQPLQYRCQPSTLILRHVLEDRAHDDTATLRNGR